MEEREAGGSMIGEDRHTSSMLRAAVEKYCICFKLKTY